VSSQQDPTTSGPETRRRLGPTPPSTLIVAALAAAAIAWLLISRFYGRMYDLTWIPPVMITALAAGEVFAARTTAARIERKPRAGKLDPLLVSRFVALAKASALAGAIFTGFYGGFSVWLAFERSTLQHAGDDLPKAIGGAVAGIVLMLAALRLERACKVPPPPDDEHDEEEDAPEIL
jgi:hypothetical protein